MFKPISPAPPDWSYEGYEISAKLLARKDEIVAEMRNRGWEVDTGHIYQGTWIGVAVPQDDSSPGSLARRQVMKDMDLAEALLLFNP